MSSNSENPIPSKRINDEVLMSEEKKVSKWETMTSGIFRKFLILLFVTYLFPECSSFGPKNSQSSLIIIQMTIVKDEMILDELIDPRFQKVTLRKGEKSIEYSESSGHYYYFQNLKEGQYEVYDAIHLLNRGASDFAFSSTKQPNKIDIDFDIDTVRKSRVDLQPGTVIFMGSFHVTVDFKFQEEPKITIRYSKTNEEELAAMDHLHKNFPRSGWGQKAKNRVKLLSSFAQ
ncbi:hypothetical protein EHQ92_02935 [Leptospira biflexa]|uniref:Uncharacterized protein n=2 Tax=Leptospira biflexa TaxID=172 RepID=B0SRA2_LEPBP|nr:hypothetical protein [Leptospira biflexa]ABZ95683.1 Hypothetical protein LBF_3215 [Leptospira biflexa serovar Patoc strain 'Patoc 1 (Ames)']ABZ99394.1 Hypothetical protein LEPBI_I3329 [Leptospira biflexa serovar Patoc strain 'Patoc 1 (Paris)']TGM37361.1 hypothetical protein EHQ80_07085 [Leptospira biflexa]TGM40698.1 hypothetical protein EHQ89_01650 [Leptospira biflexa]TGM46902.1 hypothetical protein EHQ92_02935 [Leptospira biflexa]